MVSATGEATQPPFPGGWVLALFSTLEHFLGSADASPLSPRTRTRIRQGEEFNRQFLDELLARVASVLCTYFPVVCGINDFAAKYAREYFDCWIGSLQIAPDWTRAFGYEPGGSAILARALVRDLALRFAYLESLERALQADYSLSKPSSLFGHEGPGRLYAAMIREAQEAHGCSEAEMAGRLNSTDRQLRRIRSGKAAPSWALLQEFSGAGHDIRLVAGTGFIDALLHRFDLGGGALGAELFAMAERFFPAHTHALAEMEKRGITLLKLAQRGDNLLLHPGFESVWETMPSALWRAHVYTLKFASMPDLAHAYMQFGREENERELAQFFKAAEKRSDRCPHGWVNDLRRPNPVIVFPVSDLA
jgi:hypothetical protein